MLLRSTIEHENPFMLRWMKSRTFPLLGGERAVVALRKQRPPLDKGGLQGGLGVARSAGVGS